MKCQVAETEGLRATVGDTKDNEGKWEGEREGQRADARRAGETKRTKWRGLSNNNKKMERAKG